MFEIQVPDNFKSNLIERSRLLERLSVYKNKKVIYLAGLPAQGKSVFVYQYIQNIGSKYFWIKLDLTDSIPLYFCQTILDTAKKSLSLSDYTVFKDSLGKIDNELVNSIAHYRRWVITLMHKIENRIVFVFDNLDKLNQDSEIFCIIEGLVSSAPDNIQLILISRWFPQLNLQRYIISDLAVLLSDRDLRLSIEEFHLFWLAYFGDPLPADLAKRMYAKTNGWMGALALIAAGLNSRVGDSEEAYFNQILEGNLQKDFYLYFQQEIFGFLSKEKQLFLCKISMLSRVYPEDIVSVFNEEPVASLMEQTLSMNIFIDTFVDRDKQRYYKFHPFFKEFLLVKQKQCLSYTQLNRIYLKIARFYEKALRPDIAIEFYFKAGERSEGGRVIKKLGVKILKKRKLESIVNWISCFNKSEIADDPLLQFLSFVTQPYEGIACGLGMHDRYLDGFFKNASLEESLVCLSLLFESNLLTYNQHTSTNYILKMAYKYLESCEAKQYPEACARLWLEIGRVAVYATGEIVKGLVACETARFLGQQTKEKYIETEATAIMCIGFTKLGNISSAKKNFSIFKKLFSEQDQHLKCLGIIGECIINIAVDSSDIFNKRHHELVFTIEEAYLWNFEPYAALLKVVFLMFFENLTSAAAVLESLDNWGHSSTCKIWDFHLTFFKARLKYMQNDLGSAKKLITKTILEKPGLIKNDGIYHAHAKLLAGTIDYNLGLLSSASDHLQIAMRVFIKLGSVISQCETLLIQGTMEVVSGQNCAGSQKLKKGIDLIFQNKYSYFNVLSSADIAKAVCFAVENDVSGAMDCVQLLAKKKRYRTVLENLLKNRAESYTRRMQNTIKDLRKSVYRAGLKKIYITTLGSFSVRKDQLIIDKSHWGGGQPINLLKIIIAEGCYNVSKDVIMEELWPKLDPSSMERAFKAALHRLRKTFEPDMLRCYGSSYLHLSNNHISIDSDLVEVDCLEYFTNVKCASKILNKGDLDKALAIHEKADQKYAGSFLANDLYAHWASAKRDALANMRINQLFEIAFIQEKRDQKKSALEAYESVLLYDPLNEAALLKLMIICKDIGCTTIALKTFKNFKQALEIELGLVPSESAQKLYQSIKANSAI